MRRPTGVEGASTTAAPTACMVGGRAVAESAARRRAAASRSAQTTFEVVVELPRHRRRPCPRRRAVRGRRGDPLVERTLTIADIAEIVRQIEKPKTLRGGGRARRRCSPTSRCVLSDPDAVYFVESGKVEIFTVALEDGQPVGRRAPTSSPPTPASSSSAWTPTATAWAPASWRSARRARSCADYSAARLHASRRRSPTHRERLAPLRRHAGSRRCRAG